MKKKREPQVYAGVDVGGTKIQASVVAMDGRILASARDKTPRKLTGADLIRLIEHVLRMCISHSGHLMKDVEAVGVALPGVVDYDRGRLVKAPNLKLGRVEGRKGLEKLLRVPVAVGNDCDLGTLGEATWGAASGAKSTVGIFVGTGIGGGFVRKGKLWHGARSAAMEVGHMMVQFGGPRCGCGNNGCFESLASRTAIERDLRESIKSGKKTVISRLLKGDLRMIRSGTLSQALEQKDPLTREVLRKTGEILGYGCVSIRHILDPEVIVLGGGVMEACGSYLFPIALKVFENHSLPGANRDGRLVQSALGDDAVVLGAVALAGHTGAKE